MKVAAALLGLFWLATLVPAALAIAATPVLLQMPTLRSLALVASVWTYPLTVLAALALTWRGWPRARPLWLPAAHLGLVMAILFLGIGVAR
ncbi:MAG: hypothetical protein AMXMBFR33_02540 [Candidatus Xenobia bacterium]